MLRYRLRLSLLPCSINGLALGNAGVAILWRNLGMRGLYTIAHINIVVYAFSLLAVLFLSLYLTHICLSFESFQRDFSAIKTLASLGGFTMCLSLLGSILHDLTDNIYAPIAVVLIAASLQFVFMIQFLNVCWREKNLPEPLWNAAILSSVFPSITLPGSYFFCEVIRKACVAFGLLTACFIIPVASYRTLYTSNLPLVANNPSVAILQAGSSIICSGWILAPLLGSIDDRGIGAHIGTFLFALSTTGFVTTLVALFQRRKHLWSLGMADSFAACTFPFSNTAIAAGLYQTAHFASGHSLAVWVLFLSILASALTIIVNFFFFWSIFYVLMPVNEFEPTLPLRGQETVVSVVISCADSQDNGSGSKKRSYEQDQ